LQSFPKRQDAAESTKRVEAEIGKGAPEVRATGVKVE
jgi:hypothetical protein